MAILSLALKSLRNRKFTIGLTIVSICLSVTLFLGVERLRQEARNGFTNTISGTDLIVGPRTGQIQLLLASVFRLGDMANTMGYQSYKEIAALPEIKWAVPISLGDSHRGFKVLGTNEDYFNHLRFGRKQQLELAEGTWLGEDDSAVIGADVARKLGYVLGSLIVVSHGSGDISFMDHDSHPFHVTGILKKTGTPIDQTVHVHLHGIDAIHSVLNTSRGHDHDPLGEHHQVHDDGIVSSLTAIFLGLQSRGDVLSLQRGINEFSREPLTAVIPAVALQELWQILASVEKTLLAISAFVVLVGLTGMLVAIMTSLNERRREMAILRAVGARPAHIFGLIVGEAAIVAGAGIILGIVLLYCLLALARPILHSNFGLLIDMNALSVTETMVILSMWAAGVLIGLIPGYRMYRYCLADGMTVRM